MRICFLLGSLGMGGAERTTIYLSEYALQKGWDVDIVTLNDKQFYNPPDGANYICLDKQLVKKNPIKLIWHALKRIRKFNQYARKNRPDITFCVTYESMPYALFAKEKGVLITSERGNPSNLSSKRKKKLRKFFVKRANGMIFQTNSAKKYYEDNCKVSGVVIPNAVGNAIAYEFDKPCEKRSKKIVAVGRLVIEKDYPTLIDAFNLVYKNHRDYKLEIYGGGTQEEYLKEYASQTPASGAITFMGPQQDALRRIYDASCYVLSSVSEGMPNALMEAMAIGLPCVATDCPNGPSDLIIPEYNGCLVEMKNPWQMAKALERYITDDSFAKAIAQNAMKIKESNSFENISARFFEYFQSFLKTDK